MWADGWKKDPNCDAVVSCLQHLVKILTKAVFQSHWKINVEMTKAATTKGIARNQSPPTGNIDDMFILVSQ